MVGSGYEGTTMAVSNDSGLREKTVISRYYSAYAERIRIKAVLQGLYEGTEYEDQIDKIQSMIEGGEKSAKIIYLSSLHLFSRKNGLEIYNRMKLSDELRKIKREQSTEEADG